MTGPIAYRDPFVARLDERIARLIAGDSEDAASVGHDLDELAARNLPALARFRTASDEAAAVPDSAFRGRSLFLFPDTEIVKTFRTSGTSGRSRGEAHYSRRGLALLRQTVLENALRHVFFDLVEPTVLRLVPDATAAPDNVMAHGMSLLSENFGHPGTSECCIGARGLDLDALTRALQHAVAEERPVVLIGGSFAFVHVCEALRSRGLRFRLPRGSRLVDAGGYKGRSRALSVTELRTELSETLGIASDRFQNIFGMTELASQLYDARDVPVGPKGERPKASLPFIEARVRDPHTFELKGSGAGLLEILDRTVLDRPHRVLTGDQGFASAEGVAVTGRIVASESRGCALRFEDRRAALEGAAP